MPGVIAAAQTFGDRINFHPHLHFLVTGGGVDEAGVFHKISGIDDSRLAELFGREVLGCLVRKQLLVPEWAERVLSWRHTSFNVHSRVRAKLKTEHDLLFAREDRSGRFPARLVTEAAWPR
jgi:Putative transposase